MKHDVVSSGTDISSIVFHRPLYHFRPLSYSFSRHMTVQCLVVSKLTAYCWVPRKQDAVDNIYATANKPVN